MHGNHWLNRTHRLGWTWQITSKKIPKTKTLHVPHHPWHPVAIIGAIEKHRTSRNLKTT
uniref:Uncharacterized protein n=1 Tax=Arundo donax TaxID=35708 RepID=A0A0A9GTJ4_ARUDO